MTLKDLLHRIELPPAWLAFFAAISWGVGQVVPVALPFAPVLGFALVALGVALTLAAAVQMVLARTTVIPRNTPERLVTGGLFSLSRNPIYLADVLILSGLMLIWNAVLAAPLIAVFMAVITRRFIRGEEAAIAAAHGADYAAYCARTRRWL